MKNLSNNIKILLIFTILTSLIFSLFVQSCKIPSDITDNWPTSTPEEQGMDSKLLSEALEFLFEQEEYEIHSLLIVRNGHIVTDVYFYPFSKNTLHNTFSVTKSIMGTLIGIAIDKGYIENINQQVLDFFPEITVTNLDIYKQSITIEDLLTMQTGFDFISKPEETAREMVMTAEDWVQFTLDLPMKEEPGTYFAYCSPGSHLLSAIIQQTTGMSAFEFAQRYLFGPLGISDVIWPSDPQSITRGFSDLYLTPYDMAKIGYLYLNGGVWDNQQIISKEWIVNATKAHVDFGDNKGYYGTQEEGYGYGYQWWTMTEYFSAIGAGGQQILVVPQENLVIVFTGGGGVTNSIKEAVSSYILPSVKSNEGIPPNPVSLDVLNKKIKQFSMSPQIKPGSVEPLPSSASKLSGERYQLDDNILGLKSFSLTFNQKTEAILHVTSSGRQTMGDTEFQWHIGLDGVERISSGILDLPAAAKGGWETDNYFSCQINEIGSYHKWLIGLHFEGDTVIFRLQDLGDVIDDYPKIVGKLIDESNNISTTSDTTPTVTVTNPSKGTNPGKPGYWVITVREGPNSDYPLLYFLDPQDTVKANGRNQSGDWLSLEGGGWVFTSAVVVQGDIDSLPVISLP